MTNDTIAAIATPPGQGGIAIVRVSGPRAQEFLCALFHTRGTFAPESHRLYYGRVSDGHAAVDEAMAVLMRAPRSYTREDVAELHLHGGPAVARAVLEALFALGARPAAPGEFTRRAFENGRVDLSQAEAVMSLISAGSQRAACAALRQLEGGPSAFIREAQGELLALLAGLEAALDYPDEIDEAQAAGDLAAGARALAGRLLRACDERGARILHEGLCVALCGRPNVGKSSLLNALLMEERAIVTDIPGTTRDVLTGDILADGLAVRLSDTAGLRESADAAEREGVLRARREMQSADLVLLLLDGSRPLASEDAALLDETAPLPRALVLTKSDLPHALSPGALPGGCETVRVSARTGEGLAELRALLARHAGQPDQLALTQARHMACARAAAASLSAAADALEQGAPLDLAAVDLHAALDVLAAVTGERVDEKLLDEIFSRFCVGK